MRKRSGFCARAARPLADFLKHCGGRVTGNDGNGNDAAAGSFNFFAADDLITGPIATFGENVREERGNHAARRGIVEDDDGIDALERGEDFRALALGQHGTARAFQLANAGITVESDDEHVAHGPREFEAANVAGVKQVEAAIGENDAELACAGRAVAFLAAKPHNRFLKSEDCRIQKDLHAGANDRRSETI